MANEEHFRILMQGVEEWNRWREVNYQTMPDLSCARLGRRDLSSVDFTGAVLANANLSYANLSRAKLNTNLRHANLEYANLNSSSLGFADLFYANFSYANLTDADFGWSRMGWTKFGDNDLSVARGLDTVVHEGPSIIGIDTLYKSAGEIPPNFLSGCGVPDEFITYIPDLIGAVEPIQFYSCFISYSSKDKRFANRLYSRMREENLRVWFAPEQVRSGSKLYDQIFKAIQVHDKILLILSENSLRSVWVENELRSARKLELKEDRRKLIPVRLVDYEALYDWECFDSTTGEDLAEEVRHYFIPDFTNWEDENSFEEAFSRLLQGLKQRE